MTFYFFSSAEIGLQSTVLISVKVVRKFRVGTRIKVLCGVDA